MNGAGRAITPGLFRMKLYSFCFLLCHLLLWMSGFYKIHKNRRKGNVVTDYIFTIKI